MIKTRSYSRCLPWLLVALLGASLAACGGGNEGQGPILGTNGNAVLAPTVTAVSPQNNATGVATNNSVIVAAFSEPMAPISGSGGSFTLTCASPCANPTGSVALTDASTIATFTLTPGTSLAPLTLYTATITGARSLSTGVSLVRPYVWSFTTGDTPDTTRPQVTSTVPLTNSTPTANVATNAAVAAVFSEEMSPATINTSSFTLDGPGGAPVAGTVSYAVGSRTATFTPVSPLATSTTYTATIKGVGATPVTDLSNNALAGNQAALPAASNYVWSFATSAPIVSGANDVTVLSTQPISGATGICPNASINATFNVPSGLRMNPSTVNSATFTVTGPGLTPIAAGSVALDAATGHIATFTPLNNLVSGVTYTATIVGGAHGIKDMAIPANEMARDDVWTFTVGPATGNCLQPVSLGSVSSYGIFGGSAGMTNTGTQTIINGNIGTIATTTSSITGFHDTAGDVYTETTANIGVVNGTIYTCTNSTTGPTSTGPNATYCADAKQARLDAQTAYQKLAGMPSGPDPGAGNLANLVLTPGVYTAASGSFMIQGGNLTLNAKGNANAVWVFQMATTLTVGGPGAASPQSIILINGAQAKNVFWQVGSAATIDAAGGGTMVGTIISQSGVTISTVGNTTITTLDGRALSLGASVTLVDTVINVPG